jgi:Domain of unknown function (DUF222)/HNH endonuclease
MLSIVAELPPPIAFPQPSIDALEGELTTLAAHLNAGNYRFLQLLAEFDRRGGHVGWGIASCAHWLQWKCGLGLVAAREKVRVARALAALPKLSDAMRRGVISYCKVRALTRIATPENEDVLLDIAEHGAVSHVEKTVRLYRKCDRAKALQEANEQHAERSLRCYYDEDGYVVSLVAIVEREDGSALDVGRKTRAVPAPMRRALDARDGGCRFPGCTNARFTDAHHIEHWINGGETKIANLVLLCRRHHRFVHEYGFGVERVGGGEGAELRFLRPDGRVVPTVVMGQGVEAETGCREMVAEHERRGLRIGERTGVPRWMGERMDYGEAVGAVQERAVRGRGSRRFT